MQTTGDLQLVKRINRSVLLRLLRSHDGMSRAQLALASGLTKTTVSQLVRELTEEGWLSDAGVTTSQGPGRPSTPLNLDDQRIALIGLEIAVQHLRVVGVSLTGRVLRVQEEPLHETDPEAVCKQSAEMIRNLTQQLVAQGIRTLGLGVGLPGAYDSTTGLVRLAPNMGWRNVAISQMMRHTLDQVGLSDLRVHMRNEADTAALSEYEFGEVATHDSLMFVSCDVGVGAGIVLNDRLFTGAQGFAGEVGHSVMKINGNLCSCGRRGCAETLFGSYALEKLANPDSAGQYLGVLLQNLWTMLNPNVLVVGGASCERYPGLVAKARDTLQAYAKSAGSEAPTVRSARYGRLASAVGAAALVLHDELRPLFQRPPLRRPQF